MQPRFILLVGFLFTISLPYLEAFLTRDHQNGVRIGRTLLSHSVCHSQADWIEKGGFFLIFCGVCYLFLGISIVCDDFFVKSLLAICLHLKLPDHIGGYTFHTIQLIVLVGATFMAAGSSAPELFASIVSLVNNHASNDIGVSTIVGSAVFNILCIIGVSAIFSRPVLSLDSRPIIRDCVSYSFAISTVAGVLYDSKIYWWEGLISVFLYALYIVVVSRWHFRYTDDTEQGNRALYKQISWDISVAETCPSLEDGDQFSVPLLPDTNASTSANETAITLHQHDTNTVDKAAASQNLIEDQLSSPGSVHINDTGVERFHLLQARIDQIYWFIAIPWNTAFKYTIPDCEEEKWRKWYLLTFFNSILWIGIISWFMVDWGVDIGCALGVPSAVIGVTLLAAGTSIPDALASVAVARYGKGNMAVANALGSNMFDIWLGLGLPWLFIIPVVGKNGTYGKYITIDNNDLVASVFILFGVLIFYGLFLTFARCRLEPKHGYLLIFLYLVYATFYIVADGVFDVFDSKE